MTKNKSKRLRGPDGRFVKAPAPEPVVEKPDVIEGDTYMDSQGRLLYAHENSLDKKPHSLARQPTELAFSPEQSREANRVRWDERRLAADQGLIDAAGGDVTATEAYQKVVEAQAKKALEEANTPAAKFVSQVTDSVPRSQTGQQGQAGHTTNILILRFGDLEDVRSYIEQQKAVGHLNNAAFVEGQFKDLEDEGPLEVKILRD